MPNFRQQEMPRGTGFTPGQVYNSPSVGANAMFNELNSAPNVSSQQSYTRQGGPGIGAGAMFQQMQPPNPVMPFQPVPPMPGQQPQQPQRPQQLSPAEIEMMNRYRNEQMLKQMFMQREMRGMLSDPGSVVGGDPRSVMRPQEMGRQIDPRSVVRDEEMGRY
jgi:hypothetical protein